MDREKAEKIVELISKIAEGKAAIALNLSYESTERAVHNTQIVERQKRELIDLLSPQGTEGN